MAAETVTVTKQEIGNLNQLLNGKPTASNHARLVTDLQRLDRVRSISGRIFIITARVPHRHTYPWNGVLENGNGAEYKLGPKTMLTKIGVATEDHPALRANKARHASMGRGSDSTSPDFRALTRQLLDALDAGDTVKAGILRSALKVLC
jgi:hypothetical protein